MLTTPLEKIIYHGVRKDPDYLRITKASYFDNKDIGTIFKIDKKFYERYHRLPTKEQLLTVISNNNIESITEGKLDSVFSVNLSEYDDVWLNEQLESWIEWKTLNSSVEDLVEFLRTTKIDADNISNIVHTAKEIILERNNLSLGHEDGLDFFDPESHEQPVYDTFKTGYPFMDDMLGGGFELKSLNVILGKPKIGKSIWLGNLAANAIKNGKNTTLISFEMRDRKFVKRLGANLLNIPMDEYDELAKDPITIKNRLKAIGSDTLKTPGRFFIKEYPASSVGVPQIEAYVKKLEEKKGIKISLVVIDYINIMENWRNKNSENTYMKIKQIAEDLRAMATRNEWCIVSASQITRDAFDSNDVTMNNISESVGLLNTVDSMFAIIQDPEQHLSGVYTLKALALRNSDGMDSRKDFVIDYDHMRITENPDTEVQRGDMFDSLINLDS